MQKQILRERSALGYSHHPNIAMLYGTFSSHHSLYMLCEPCTGGELYAYMREVNTLEEKPAAFYAACVIAAVEYMHSRDIMYRDLKPENLVIAANGYVKVVDFGFAKVTSTKTYTLCGTPEYLAPEIIQSKGHGKAVDWWALGILVYEMLAGYPPFYDENPFGIYQKILAGKIEFPRHFDVHAKDLIKKLLTADRSKRLGNLKAGAEDVKKHKWFRNFQFKDLIDAELAAPVNPDVKGEGDTHNFDQYPDSQEDGHAPALDAAAAKKYFESF